MKPGLKLTMYGEPVELVRVVAYDSYKRAHIYEVYSPARKQTALAYGHELKLTAEAES